MPEGLIRMPKFQGVYYRESNERRHQGKPDRCFYISYRIPGGKFKREKIGWQSEGYTAVLAYSVRGDRIRAIRHGEDLPQKKNEFNLDDVWVKYDEWLETNKAHPRHDRVNYRVHVGPRFGLKKLSEVTPSDLEKMKAELMKAGKSSALVKHCLVLVRQLFNKAIAWGMFFGSNPVSLIKLPKLDNARKRFLTKEESETLLKALALRCPKIMQMAFLSLKTGLRAGELFSLKWSGIDLDNGIIHVLGKSGEYEQVYMGTSVKAMFDNMRIGAHDELVFPARGGGMSKWVSSCFPKTVDDLGFNDGIKDHSQLVTFHTLRHTFASWLALKGIPIYTIKELMRHKDIKMTMRYAHLVPDHKRDAINEIDDII